MGHAKVALPNSPGLTRHYDVSALELLLGCIVLFISVNIEAQTAYITSISPSFGPTTGGTEVVIIGYFPQICGVPECPDASVSFGGVAVPVTRVGGVNTLRVITPAHPVGAVDVAYHLAFNPPVVVPNGFTYVSALGAAPGPTLSLPMLILLGGLLLLFGMRQIAGG